MPVGAKFSVLISTSKPTSPPIQWVLGLCRGVKWPWNGVDKPRPSSAEDKSD